MRQKDLAEEQALVERAKTDPEAFGLIFDRYYTPILNYTVRRTSDVALAEDLVAETFIKAMKKLPFFRWQGTSIEAWLFAIATNEIRMHYRRRRFTVSLDDLFERQKIEIAGDQDIAADAQEAQEKLMRHRQFIEAHELLSTLSLKYQEVIFLRFAQHKKIVEIAKILNKSEGTVKSLLSRALTKLRKQMQPNRATSIVVAEGDKRP